VRDRLEQRGIRNVELIPGKSGQFDVLVDGQLKYSRYSTGTFPGDQDIDALGAG
jgi:predicted Rdx family selenoprotein